MCIPKTQRTPLLLKDKKSNLKFCRTARNFFYMSQNSIFCAPKYQKSMISAHPNNLRVQEPQSPKPQSPRAPEPKKTRAQVPKSPRA